ncbi:MAG: MBL fold metallo-hydrolase, partial [Emergencia timonensis]
GMCIIAPGYVFSGDTLFRASIGRTDFYGGDFNEIIKSIRERLFVLPDNTVVLPGHMGETTIAYEKEHNPFV